MLNRLKPSPSKRIFILTIITAEIIIITSNTDTFHAVLFHLKLSEDHKIPVDFSGFRS